ncbi:MAG: radical SAM protein, partial [Candidatus Omnitrophota bacterium]|jgi:hypothetical protein
MVDITGAHRIHYQQANQAILLREHPGVFGSSPLKFTRQFKYFINECCVSPKVNLVLRISRGCSQQCAHCFVDSPREIVHMPLRWAEEIISFLRNVRDELRPIRFDLDNDPLQYPYIVRILKLALREGVTMQRIVTKGWLRGESQAKAMAEEIARGKIMEVVFSCNLFSETLVWAVSKSGYLPEELSEGYFELNKNIISVLLPVLKFISKPRLAPDAKPRELLSRLIFYQERTWERLVEYFATAGIGLERYLTQENFLVAEGRAKKLFIPGSGEGRLVNPNFLIGPDNAFYLAVDRDKYFFDIERIVKDPSFFSRISTWMDCAAMLPAFSPLPAPESFNSIGKYALIKLGEIFTSSPVNKLPDRDLTEFVYRALEDTGSISAAIKSLRKDKVPVYYQRVAKMLNGGVFDKDEIKRRQAVYKANKREREMKLLLSFIPAYPNYPKNWKTKTAEELNVTSKTLNEMLTRNGISIEEIKRDYVKRALNKHKRPALAAKALGITAGTLYAEHGELVENYIKKRIFVLLKKGRSVDEVAVIMRMPLESFMRRHADTIARFCKRTKNPAFHLAEKVYAGLDEEAKIKGVAAIMRGFKELDVGISRRTVYRMLDRNQLPASEDGLLKVRKIGLLKQARERLNKEGAKDRKENNSLHLKDKVLQLFLDGCSFESVYGELNGELPASLPEEYRGYL